MTPKPDNSPPAFPTPTPQHNPRGDLAFACQAPGMSLRQWYAGRAIGDCIASAIEAAKRDPNLRDEINARYIAAMAFEYADAMIAERGERVMIRLECAECGEELVSGHCPCTLPSPDAKGDGVVEKIRLRHRFWTHSISKGAARKVTTSLPYEAADEIDRLIAAAPKTAAERDRLIGELKVQTAILGKTDIERRRLKEANKALVEALDAEIERCHGCGGSGFAYTMEDETEIGQSPGSSRIDCPDCRDSRAALKAGEG